MSHALEIEFFKLAADGAVEKLLEKKSMSFAGRDWFMSWAQAALSARRCENHLQEWPEAVRACGPDGVENTASLFKFEMKVIHRRRHPRSTSISFSCNT